MRIAIPMQDEAFCPHFGRSNAIFLADVDVSTRKVDRPRTIDRQATGCDSLPGWLADLAVNTVVAGGIGAGAIAGLAERGILVSAGHTGTTPDEVLASFFNRPEGDADAACSSHDHESHHCRH
jgi:predicted Fe-Mo cluster-binding NifX family protein